MCDNEGNMFQYDKENEGMIIDVNHNIVSQRIVQFFNIHLKQLVQKSGNGKNTDPNKGVNDNKQIWELMNISTQKKSKKYEDSIQQQTDKI